MTILYWHGRARSTNQSTLVCACQFSDNYTTTGLQRWHHLLTDFSLIKFVAKKFAFTLIVSVALLEILIGDSQILFKPPNQGWIKYLNIYSVAKAAK